MFFCFTLRLKQTQGTHRGEIVQLVIFTLQSTYNILSGRWQWWYFLWGIWCMTNTLTLFWLNNCITSQWAADLLRPSASYVNAHPGYNERFNVQHKSPSTQRSLSPCERLTQIPISFDSCDNVRKCTILYSKSSKCATGGITETVWMEAQSSV